MIVSKYDYLKSKREKEKRERDNALKNDYVEISDSEGIDLNLNSDVTDFVYNCSSYPNKYFTNFLLNPNDGNYCMLFIKYNGDNIYELFYIDKYNNSERFNLENSKLNNSIFEWIEDYNMYNPYCILLKYNDSKLEIGGGHYNFPDVIANIFSGYIGNYINYIWNDEKYIFEDENNYSIIMNVGSKGIYYQEFNEGILRLKINGRKA